MKSPNPSLQDKDIEKIMGNLLRFGVSISAIIVFIGAIFYFIQHGTEIPKYRKFIGEPKRITEIKLVWKTAFEGRGRSIIQLGLFILIATPIARIVFSIIGYIVERDHLYTCLTIIVLLIIIYNLIN